MQQQKFLNKKRINLKEVEEVIRNSGKVIQRKNIDPNF
jgi:hypothetical protein